MKAHLHQRKITPITFSQVAVWDKLLRLPETIPRCNVIFVQYNIIMHYNVLFPFTNKHTKLSILIQIYSEPTKYELLQLYRLIPEIGTDYSLALVTGSLIITFWINLFGKVFYYTVEFSSRLKMKRSESCVLIGFPSGVDRSIISRVGPARKSSLFWPFNKPFIDQMMAGYWPCSSLAFIDLDFVSIHNWLISSHLNLTFVQ